MEIHFKSGIKPISGKRPLPLYLTLEDSRAIRFSTGVLNLCEGKHFGFCPGPYLMILEDYIGNDLKKHRFHNSEVFKNLLQGSQKWYLNYECKLNSIEYYKLTPRPTVIPNRKINSKNRHLTAEEIQYVAQVLMDNKHLSMNQIAVQINANPDQVYRVSHQIFEK